jgi:TetR/AcrR family transcriptional regulator, transcriptional repressor for nem operon
MSMRRQSEEPDTAAQVLDVAERLVQRQGFNGFSYADIAAELGLTKAALHYHFAGKADLGEALVARYAARFAVALDALDGAGADAPAKLEGYTNLYLDVLRNERMCLCGMLAAEFQTLPAPMRTAVVEFFDYNERWLAGVLEGGRDEGAMRFQGPPAERARMIVGALEGAMLVARTYGEVARFETAAAQLVHELVIRTADTTST